MIINFWPLIEEAKQYPPIPAKKELPEWYRDCPVSPLGSKEKPSAKEMNLNPGIQCSTIKRCPPVQDFLTGGYIIRNFIDIQITQETTVDGIEQVYFHHNKSIGKPYISTHMKGQFPGIGVEKQVLKLHGVWSIKTPPGYSCLFYPLFYHNLHNSIRFLPAIVDTDMYNNPVSFPFVLKDLKSDCEKEHFLESGMPIIGLYPFQRDNWKAIIHNCPKPNDKSRVRMLTQLYHQYKKYFRHSKKFN